jgi:F-type H+-transporting ATPase subunit c
VDHQLIAQGATAVTNVDPTVLITAASRVGAGIAAVGVFGPGIGIGVAAAKALEGMARQPEMEKKLMANAITLAALMEALGLFAFAVAMLLFLFPMGLGK